MQHDSQELTPVDTGNLKGSAYTNPPIVDAKGKDGEVEVGYTAEYAAFVHEQDKNYNTGQWKFLETALNNNKTRILKILRGELKI